MNPKLKEAIKLFASEQDVQSLIARLTCLLEDRQSSSDANEDNDDNSNTEDRDDDDTGAIFKDWESGVEHLSKKTYDDLIKDLNLVSESGAPKTFPQFNEMYDPNTPAATPWNEAEWTKASAAAHLEELKPRWHQVVGVHKMVANAVKGLPTMVMDDVGVGKTMQAVGLITVLASLVDMRLSKVSSKAKNFGPWGTGEYTEYVYHP